MTDTRQCDLLVGSSAFTWLYLNRERGLRHLVAFFQISCRHVVASRFGGSSCRKSSHVFPPHGTVFALRIRPYSSVAWQLVAISAGLEHPLPHDQMNGIRELLATIYAHGNSPLATPTTAVPRRPTPSRARDGRSHRTPQRLRLAHSVRDTASHAARARARTGETRGAERSTYLAGCTKHGGSGRRSNRPNSSSRPRPNSSLLEGIYTSRNMTRAQLSTSRSLALLNNPRPVLLPRRPLPRRRAATQSDRCGRSLSRLPSCH